MKFCYRKHSTNGKRKKSKVASCTIRDANRVIFICVSPVSRKVCRCWCIPHWCHTRSVSRLQAGWARYSMRYIPYKHLNTHRLLRHVEWWTEYLCGVLWSSIPISMAFLTLIKLARLAMNCDCSQATMIVFSLCSMVFYRWKQSN